MGAWPVKGLLAPPVQGFVYITRLIFYLHREKMMRLHLALFSHSLEEAFINQCILVDHLRLMHEDLLIICHTAYNLCSELHHGLVERAGVRLHLSHSEGRFLQGR